MRSVIRTWSRASFFLLGTVREALLRAQVAALIHAQFIVHSSRAMLASLPSIFRVRYKSVLVVGQLTLRPSVSLFIELFFRHSSRMKEFNLESSPRTPPSLPSTSTCAHVPPFPSRSQMPVPTEVSASLAQTPPYRFSPPSHTVTPSVTPSSPSTPSSIGCWGIESLLQGHTLHTTNGTSDGVQIDERPLTDYSRSRPGGTGNNHTIIPTFRPHQYPYPGLPAGVPPTAYTRRQEHFVSQSAAQ